VSKSLQSAFVPLKQFRLHNFNLLLQIVPLSRLAKMKDLIRDTIPSHLLRLATGGKVLQYEEERDPSLWKRYVDKENSGRLAHHGNTEEEGRKEKADDTGDGIAGNDKETAWQKGIT